MAENKITVSTEDIPAATAFEQRLKALTSTFQLVSPRLRAFSTALKNAVDNSRKFGASMVALGGLAGVALTLRRALEFLNDSAKEAAERLNDFAKTGEGITNRMYGNKVQDLPQLYKEKSTLEKQLRSQSATVMQAGNNLPSGYWAAGWDKLKGTGAANLLGVESAAQDYEFQKSEMQKTEAQLKWVNSQIRKLETEKGRADKADAKAAAKEDKEWVSGIIDAAKQALREGEYEIAEIIADKQEQMDEKKAQEEEDKNSRTLLSNAPMAIQEEIRNAGQPETMLVSKRADFIRNQISLLDRIGGYTSNLVNAQTSPELTEMKKQSAKLEQIAENTKKTSARYSG